MRLLSIVLAAGLFVSCHTQPRVSPRVNAKDGLTYVWIPAGTFAMGCSPSDGECADEEKPTHYVTITKGFWIGQTEVTQAAYERVIGSNPSIDKGALVPVNTISWDEARAYCVAVGMRLPTEAEWEYAARGGDSSKRYGDLDAVAWHRFNTADGPHEVGKKQPNGYGLYDALGNVQEWVADWFGEIYYTSHPASDPQGPSSGTARVVRGGSCSNSGFGESQTLRASSRRWFPPPESGDVGVRCAGNDLPGR